MDERTRLMRETGRRKLEEFRRAKERRAATPRADDPASAPFTPSTLAPTPSARRGDASRRRSSRPRNAGVADLDSLAGFDELALTPPARAAHDLDGTPDGTHDGTQSSAHVIRALRDEASRLRRDAAETERENEQLRGEVKHLEDLVDGLVRLLEGVDAAVEGDRPESKDTRKHANHENIVSDTSNGPSNGGRRAAAFDSPFDALDGLAAETARRGPPASARDDSLEAWLEGTVALGLKSIERAHRCATVGVGGRALDFDGMGDSPFDRARQAPSSPPPRAGAKDVRSILETAEAFLGSERAGEV